MSCQERIAQKIWEKKVAFMHGTIVKLNGQVSLSQDSNTQLHNEVASLQDIFFNHNKKYIFILKGGCTEASSMYIHQNSEMSLKLN